MAPRRTERQLAFDSWNEDGHFRPEVEKLITVGYGGRYMHPNKARVRAGQTITPTNVPWPDETFWFPGNAAAFGRLFVVELKTHDHRVPREGQPELFDSLRAAGIPVPIWEPRYLDDVIPEALKLWTGIDPPEPFYRDGLYVPRALRLRAQLRECATP